MQEVSLTKKKAKKEYYSCACTTNYRVLFIQTGVHFHASFHPSQCLKATMVAMVETCTIHSCISSSMMV